MEAGSRFNCLAHPPPLPDHLLRAELAFHAVPPGGADLLRNVAMIEQILGPASQTGAMAGGDKIAGCLVFDQIARAWGIYCHDGHPGGHGFENRLGLARQPTR